MQFGETVAATQFKLTELAEAVATSPVGAVGAAAHDGDVGLLGVVAGGDGDVGLFGVVAGGDVTAGGSDEAPVG
jgi:hypothetical protein